VSNPADPLDTSFVEPGEADATRAVDEFTFLAQDANYDGVLSRDEFDAGRSAHDQDVDPERFSRYDRDGDGTITRDEFLAGMARDRARMLESEPGDEPG
jgi:Ca2+-binding EF-hand superfamily protein